MSSSSTTDASARSGVLVFTDLDATLLDEEYQWNQAQPALDELRKLEFPLVLNSSKTLAEMRAIASELQTEAPIVAENGALVAIPLSSPLAEHAPDYETTGDFKIEYQGMPRGEILRIAHSLREQNEYQFQGFHDWNVEEVAARTGLSHEASQKAQERHGTEPILWEDTPERRADFEKALSLENIKTIRGGRFIHLMGDSDKVKGMQSVLEFYKKAKPGKTWTVVALGDSPNDLDMLSAADIAVVIPRPGDSATLNPNAPNVIRPTGYGPSGWNEAMLTILQSYLRES